MISAEKTRDKALRAFVSRMVKKEYEGWPPGCCFFMYQPKRPSRATQRSGSKDDIRKA